MLTRLLHAARTFLQNEDGPTAVEYAVMLTLIVVACIVTVTALGGNANGIFGVVAGVFGGSGGTGDSAPVGGTSWDSGRLGDSFAFNADGTYSEIVDSTGLPWTSGTYTQNGSQIQFQGSPHFEWEYL
jgi:pilus assembly protein Flp/PilA